MPHTKPILEERDTTNKSQNITSIDSEQENKEVYRGNYNATKK